MEAKPESGRSGVIPAMEEAKCNDDDDTDIEDGPPYEQVAQVEAEARMLRARYGNQFHQGFPNLNNRPSSPSAGSTELREEVREFLVTLGSPSARPQLLINSEGHESMGLPTTDYSGSTMLSDAEGDNVRELLNMEPSVYKALALNRALQQRFRQRHQALADVLVKNRERQAEILGKIKESQELREAVCKSGGGTKPSLRISYFSVPYFKTSSEMNAAPMNEDAIAKVERGYMDLYTMRLRAWTARERSRLVDAVHEEWKANTLKERRSRLRELTRKHKALAPDAESTDEEEETTEGRRLELQADIHFLEREIEYIEKTPFKDIEPPREAKLDWEKIAAQTFDGHRNSGECRLQWENLMHPSINRSDWTEQEDLKLQDLVLSSKHPNWDAIAAKLQTGRTSLMTMQRWVSFIHPVIRTAKWTPEATQKLIDTVNMLRTGNFIPWAQVHQHMVGFSRSQLQSRWRVINPDISKGPFTVEEDFILIKGLHMFGLNFDSIAHFMPGRTAAQARDRYRRTILPGFIQHPWTIEEDDVVIKHGQVGTKDWKRMMTEHLSRRTPCQIRGRYFVIQVWQTLSQTNMVPPPLFPITMTVDKEKVDEIRKQMILESASIKQLVDRTRKGVDVKSTIRELEERRLMIIARKADASCERLKKLTERRGRRRGQIPQQPTSLGDVMLEEFFLPHTKSQTAYTHAGKDTHPTLAILSRVMRLASREGVYPSEEVTARALRLTQEDLDAVAHLVKDESAPGCSKWESSKMPLVPSNQTTVGALRSLLLLQPKLTEMATGEFLLHRKSWDELAKEGSDPKLRKQALRRNMPKINRPFRLPEILSHDSSEVVDDPGEAAAAANDSKFQEDSKGNHTVWRLEVPGLGGDGGHDGEITVSIGSKEPEPTPQDSCSGPAAVKFHVTAQSTVAAGRRTKRKSSLHHNMTTYSRGSQKADTQGSEDSSTVATQASVSSTTTNSTTDTIPDTTTNATPQTTTSVPDSTTNATQSTATDPSTAFVVDGCVRDVITLDSTTIITPPSMSRAENPPPKPKRRQLKPTRMNTVMARTDDLLFQRMLSLFFWPTLMSLIEPSSKLEKLVAETQCATEDRDGDDEDNEEIQGVPPRKKQRVMKTKDELDIEEMEEYIRELAEKDSLYRMWRAHKSKEQQKRKVAGEEELEVGAWQPWEKVQGEVADPDDPCSGSEGQGKGRGSKQSTSDTNTTVGRGRGQGRGRGRGQGRGRGRGQGRGRGSMDIKPEITCDTDMAPEVTCDSSSESTDADASDANQPSTSNSTALTVDSVPTTLGSAEIQEAEETTGAVLYRRKKNLASLRRSLSMKKLWMDRRAGNRPDRTSTRNKRTYIVRSSRTRESKHPAPKKGPPTPRLCDMPLDGPIKVQPQVPLDKSVLEKLVNNEEGKKQRSGWKKGSEGRKSEVTARKEPEEHTSNEKERDESSTEKSPVSKGSVENGSVSKGSADKSSVSEVAQKGRVPDGAGESLDSEDSTDNGLIIDESKEMGPVLNGVLEKGTEPRGIAGKGPTSKGSAEKISKVAD